MITIINADLTSHVVNEDNTLEFFLPSHNPETLIPFGSEEEVQTFVTHAIKNPNYFSRVLSDEEKAVITAEQAAIVATEYQRQRSFEYPAITDYLDGIVKGDTEQVQAYIDACLAVKAKYPKPE
jgi:hypothetical protein